MKFSAVLLALLLLPILNQICTPTASDDYTAIVYLPYDILSPGKYRLEIVGNVTINGTSIRILRTHDVLLDLNGKFLLGYGSGSGIIVFDSSNVTITNGFIEDFTIGVNVTSSFNVSINNCTVRNVSYGIVFQHSSTAEIHSCTLKRCKTGLHLYASLGLTANNTQIKKIDDYAACIFSSNNTALCNCNLSANPYGFAIFILGYSNNLLLHNCRLSRSYHCLLAFGVENITAFGCSVSGSRGFSMYFCSHVNLVYSNFTNCSEYALSLSRCDNVTVFLNNFIDNGLIWDVNTTYSSVLWYSPAPLSYIYRGKCYVSHLGNYWDRYQGYPDYDENGVYDLPHILHYPYTWIEDYYPLVDTKEHYLLKKTFEIDYTAEIVEGWNTFSLTAIPESCEVSAIFKDGDVAVYEWNPSTNSYSSAKEIIPGKGYWVYSSKKFSKNIYGYAVDEVTLYLQQGWNFIATIYAPEDSQVKLTCLEGKISPIFYEWSPSQKSYIPVTQLQPGKAYWIYASENSTIVLSQQ